MSHRRKSGRIDQEFQFKADHKPMRANGRRLARDAWQGCAEWGGIDDTMRRVFAAVFLSLGAAGCQYTAEPLSVGAYNVYTSYDNKLPGKYCSMSIRTLWPKPSNPLISTAQRTATRST